MMKAMTSAIAGLKAHQTAMDVVGNNIANVNTYAFKSSSTTFRDTMYQTTSAATQGNGTTAGSDPTQIGFGASATGINVDTTQGGQDATGNAMDCYIDGNGYFVVAGSATPTPTAATAEYTRVGQFSFDSNGDLVDGNGNYVLNSNYGIINDKGDTSIKISSQGVITGVNASGGVDTLGTIGLATFPNPAGLQEAGGSYYKTSDDSGVPTHGGTAALTTPGADSTVGTLTTGVLESSNVDLATELSNMIVYERGYQANTKIITVADEMLQTLINMK